MMADIQELKKLNVPGSSWAQVKPAFLKILGDSGALHHASKIKELEDKLNDKYHFAPDAKNIKEFLQAEEFEIIFGGAAINIRKFIEAAIDEVSASPSVSQSGYSSVPLNVRTAFVSEYVDNDSILQKFNDRVIKTAKTWRGLGYIAPYFPIVQSSGYGKSRLLFECAKLSTSNIYTCYFSFAEGTAYPAMTYLASCILLFPKTHDIEGHLLNCLKACIWNFKQFIDNNPQCTPTQWHNHFLESQEVCNPPKFDIAAVLDDCATKSQFNTLLFAFDEARVLVKHNLFSPLQRALGSLGSTNRVCAVFADTSSKITNFAPPAELDSSLRYLNNTVPLPLYLLPTLDIYANGLFNCGRPLWKAYATTNEKVSIAKAKLLGGSFHALNQVPYGEPQTAAALACAGSRCAINFNPAHSMASYLVANNMATLVAVSPDIRVMYSMYPSEPVLSEAAAQLMASGESFTKILTTLYTQIQVGAMDKGERGELVSRIIMLRCFDSFVKDQDYSQCEVKVSDFIARLSNFKHWSKETEEPKQEVKTIDGTVSFTHFIKIHYKPTVEDLRKAYERRVAFALKKGSGIDSILPVKLSRGRFAALIWQDKNYSKSTAKKKGSGAINHDAHKKMSIFNAMNDAPPDFPYTRLIFRYSGTKEMVQPEAHENLVIFFSIASFGHLFEESHIDLLFKILDADLDVRTIGIDEETLSQLYRIFPLIFGPNVNTNINTTTTTTTTSTKRTRDDEVAILSKVPKV